VPLGTVSCFYYWWDVRSAAFTQAKHKVIIDQDAAGPGGTDMQAILALINSPDTEVLGITVLTGDGWRDEEVHTPFASWRSLAAWTFRCCPALRFPLVNSKEYIAKWERSTAKLFTRRVELTPRGMPSMDHTKFSDAGRWRHDKASTEDAAHFLVAW